MSLSSLSPRLNLLFVRYFFALMAEGVEHALCNRRVSTKKKEGEPRDARFFAYTVFARNNVRLIQRFHETARE
jgi:hypothetical protein